MSVRCFLATCGSCQSGSLGCKLSARGGRANATCPCRQDSLDHYTRYKGADDLLASGYLWAENREQRAYKPFLVIQPEGRGFVIAFTANPTVRAYLDGLNVLLLNAVFRGAAHANPVR